MALARVEVVFQRFPGTAGSAADRAVANADFKVTIGKHTSNGKTDADGKAVIFMPSNGKAVLEIFGTKYAVTPVKTLEAKSSEHGIQRRLQGLGYELGTVDGAIGRRTGVAILQFEADNALKTNGDHKRPEFETRIVQQFGA